MFKDAQKLYSLVVKAYENQNERSDAIQEYWNIYNAMPDENLQYTGNSQGYIPAVRDCINARSKRTLKTLFPANHKHVDAVSSDGTIPYTPLSLLEHYIRKLQLSAIVRSDLVAGDVTGQWGLMLDWTKSERRVSALVKRNPVMEKLDGEDASELGLEDPLAEEQDEEIEERDVVDEGPDIVDFATEDLAVIPATCNDLQKARVVAVKLRLSKDAVEAMVDEGTFIMPDDTDIDGLFGVKRASDRKNRDKKQSEDAGVRTEGADKHLLVFMVYSKLQFDADDPKRSGIAFFAGPDTMLGLIKNPLWSGKVPVISAPVDRVKGSFCGKSKIEPVKFLQWNLCDFWNMGQDSAMYSMLPIWAVNPLTTPQWAQLVMGLGAVWPVNPNDVKSMTSPALWKDAAGICDLIKRQIWESMDVNEMMMGKTPQGRKNNALIGGMQQEQATNITDHAERYEEVILNPLVEMLFEFDQQFRTTSVTIEQRGEIGVKAAAEEVPVQEWGEKIFFSWTGTAFANNMQMIQGQISWVNVLKGIPPQLMGGKRLDLGPFVEAGTNNIFGPELAPRILVDERNMFTIDPGMENEILHNGMAVQVHQADDDSKHLQEHMRGASLAGDPEGLYKRHMADHMVSMQAKREKEMQQQQPKGVPGGPPGAQPPGVAGAPRPGAMPAPGGARPAQNPPGAMNPDSTPGMEGRG